MTAVVAHAGVVVEIPRTVTARGAHFALAFDVPSLETGVASEQSDFSTEATNFRGYYDDGNIFRFEDYDVRIDGLTFKWNGHSVEWLGGSQLSFGIAHLDHYPVFIQFIEGASRAALYFDLSEPDSVRLPAGSFLHGEGNGTVPEPGALALLCAVGVAGVVAARVRSAGRQ